MHIIWERLKIILEPSSTVALAALLREKDTYKNTRIEIIISGGNVDLSNLPFSKINYNRNTIANSVYKKIAIKSYI